MARVNSYLDLLPGEASRHLLDPARPEDDAILALMVHMACSDSVIDAAEVDFFCRVLPGRDPTALRAWMERVGSIPLDPDGLRAALPTEDGRWRAFRFAARMAWKDGYLAVEEEVLLARIAEILDLPAGARERALTEVRPGRDITAATIMTSLQTHYWRAVTKVPGDVISPDLRAALPTGVRPVVRVGVEGVEIVALYVEGMLARFAEGPMFLYWPWILEVTRGVGLDAGVEVHTEDGRTWTLVDVRMSGLIPVVDHIFRGSDRPSRAKPVIEQLTGQDQDESVNP